MKNLSDYLYKAMNVSDILDIAKLFNETDDNPYQIFPTIYSNLGVEKITLDTVCFLGESSQVSDDGLEVYPDFITQNGLSVLCYGFTFIEIFDYISETKESFSVQDFINVLNYYIENDDYLDL